MSIEIVTFAQPKQYREIVEAGIVSKEVYAQKHGYVLLSEEKAPDASRHHAWQKILLLQMYMRERSCDWFFWSDADSIIMDYDKRLETFLTDAGVTQEHQMLLTRDPRGSMNLGNFFIRNSAWSMALLQAIYDYPCPRDTKFFEQIPFCLLYRENFGNMQKAIRVEQRTWRFNAYPEEKNTIQNRNVPAMALYHKGDFLVHFAGIQGEELRVAMKNFAGQHARAAARTPDIDGAPTADFFKHLGVQRGPDYIIEDLLNT